MYHSASTVSFFFFFFNDTATTEIYTLSLHDALPIYADQPEEPEGERDEACEDTGHDAPMRERPPEERAVPVPQALEAAVERPGHRPDAPRIGGRGLRARGAAGAPGRQQGADPPRDAR